MIIFLFVFLSFFLNTVSLYSQDNYISTDCENISNWYISEPTDFIYYPPNKKTCRIRESFKDESSADIALCEAKRKFIKAVSEYSGKTLVSLQIVEDGELTKDINYSFSVEEINTDCKIVERNVNAKQSEIPWNIVVECKARVDKRKYKDYVEKLTREALNNPLLRYDLKKGRDYVNTPITGKTIDRREIFSRYEELRDYFDWVEFDKQFVKVNEKNEVKLDIFTKSSNPIVNRQSTVKQAKYQIKKFKIKEVIEKIKMLINRGEDSAELRNKLGVAYWKGGYSLSLAETEFKKSLEFKPGYDLKRKILYNLSTVLGMQGKYKESLALLENYKDIDKDGRILRSTIRSRLSQFLICKDLKEACGNDKKGICQNWSNALLKGDCLESGDSSVKELKER